MFKPARKADPAMPLTEARAAPEPRPLRGMGQIIGPDSVEQIVADIRAEANARFGAKMDDIFRGSTEGP